MAKPRRKTRRKFAGPRIRRAPWFKDDTYMHRYEEAIIMRDVASMTAGGNLEISTRRLRLYAPMRYSRNLKQALERLALQGRIRRSHKVRDGVIYKPVEDAWRAAA